MTLYCRSESNRGIFLAGDGVDLFIFLFRVIVPGRGGFICDIGHNIVGYGFLHGLRFLLGFGCCGRFLIRCGLPGG